jgi:glycosyltransferase involved in cell wall biosynthesis
LLEAYELYYATVVQPAALVLIGGDGWQNDTILEKIKTLQASGHQIIHPKTYVPDEYLPALYSGACVLVHLAIHEGFGLPPLQAEACGTPVIASDIAALREILDPATTTFVALDNPKKVARELSTHDRHQPRGAAFDHYKNRYSWKETAAKLRNIAIMK